MPQSLITLAYLAAGLLFIFSLHGLAAQETARRGNVLGILGMVMAVVATAVGARWGRTTPCCWRRWWWAAASARCWRRAWR